MTTRILEVYWILAGVLGTVSLASVAGLALKARRRGDPTIENLNARIRSWWVLILVSGGALLAGRIAVILLFAVVSALALREFHAPVRRAEYAAWWMCVLLATPAQYAVAGGWLQGEASIYIPLLGFPALAVTTASIVHDGHALNRAALTLCGLVVCIYGISCIPWLMALRIPGYERRTPILMVFLVLIAQVSDVLQYVWGKLLGRHRVAPTLSPSKTVEGLVGGVLSATLLGALLWPLTPFTVCQAGLMAFLIAVLGFLGGLAMSAIKRSRGIKDWGRLIEGHGGMLDRIDSLCFSAPLFFHLTRHFFSRG